MELALFGLKAYTVILTAVLIGWTIWYYRARKSFTVKRIAIKIELDTILAIVLYVMGIYAWIYM